MFREKIIQENVLLICVVQKDVTNCLYFENDS